MPEHPCDLLRRRWFLAFLGLAVLVTPAVVSRTPYVQAQDKPPYKDASLPVDVRVSDLLARMTLVEKIAQLVGIWDQTAKVQDAKGVFDAAKAKDVLGNGLGQASRPSEVKGANPGRREPREQATFTPRAFAMGIESATHRFPSGSDLSQLRWRTSRHKEAMGRPTRFDSSR